MCCAGVSSTVAGGRAAPDAGSIGRVSASRRRRVRVSRSRVAVRAIEYLSRAESSITRPDGNTVRTGLRGHRAAVLRYYYSGQTRQDQHRQALELEMQLQIHIQYSSSIQRTGAMREENRREDVRIKSGD